MTLTRSVLLAALLIVGCEDGIQMPGDAGARDAAPRDAEPRDAMAGDAERTDVESADGESADVGSADADPLDGGTADSGVPPPQRIRTEGEADETAPDGEQATCSFWMDVEQLTFGADQSWTG